MKWALRAMGAVIVLLLLHRIFYGIPECVDVPCTTRLPYYKNRVSRQKQRDHNEQAVACLQYAIILARTGDLEWQQPLERACSLYGDDEPPDPCDSMALHAWVREREQGLIRIPLEEAMSMAFCKGEVRRSGLPYPPVIGHPPEQDSP